MRFWRLMLLFSIASSLPFAAVVKGTLYDADTLDLVEKAIVTVNTIPEQVKVTQGGEYSFEIPPGSYAITAKKYEGKLLALEASENITIADNGTYVLDLLLFPQTEFFSTDEGNRTIDEVDYEPLVKTSAGTAGGKVAPVQPDLLQTVLGIAILIMLAYFLLNKFGKKGELETGTSAAENIRKAATAKAKQKHPTSVLILTPEQKQAIGILKKAGGHATQKELRKAMPFSEAKVSLIVTELEEMKAVKKFRRGRGNIIKLLKG